MKDIKRKLYGGGGGDIPDAMYELGAGPGDKEISLRVYDVIGGDALVFLTEARAKKLIADIQRAMAARQAGRRSP